MRRRESPKAGLDLYPLVGLCALLIGMVVVAMPQPVAVIDSVRPPFF